MQRRIDNIENRLRKREAIMNQSPIVIRDLVAYQPELSRNQQPPMGEFSERLVNSANARVSALETDEAVALRIFAFIEQIATIAEQTHVKDNYVNTQAYFPLNQVKALAAKRVAAMGFSEKTHPEYTTHLEDEIRTILEENQEKSFLDPLKVNNVTRLSLNEFCLYPHEKRGPLSIEAFTLLLTKLDDLASKLPNNIHLYLASVPVVIDNQVLNLAIKVESGSTQRLQPLVKAMPSDIDPSYPNLGNLRYTDSKFSGNPIKNLRSKLNQLNTNLSNRKLVKKDLLELSKACSSFPQSSTVTKKLAKLAASMKKSSVEYNHHLVLEVDDIFNEINILTRSITKAANEEVALNPPKLTIGSTHVALDFSNYKETRTQGGASFLTGIEICLDHTHGVVISRLKNDLITLANNEEVLPTRRTHVITSNTTPLVSDNTIAGTITQADPIHTAERKSVLSNNQPLQPQHTVEIKKPAFGSYTKIDIYSQRELTATSSDAFDQQIKKQNQFVIQLKALHIDRAQHPADMVVLNEKIDRLILSQVLEKLALTHDLAKEYGQKIENNYGNRQVEMKILTEIESMIEARGDASLAALKQQIVLAKSRISQEEIDTQKLLSNIRKGHLSQSLFSNGHEVQGRPIESSKPKLNSGSTCSTASNDSYFNFVQMGWLPSVTALGAALGFYQYPQACGAITSNDSLSEKSKKEMSADMTLRKNHKIGLDEYLAGLCGQNHMDDKDMVLIRALIVAAINGELSDDDGKQVSNLEQIRNKDLRFKALVQFAQEREGHFKYSPK